MKHKSSRKSERMSSEQDPSDGMLEKSTKTSRSQRRDLHVRAVCHSDLWCASPRETSQTGFRPKGALRVPGEELSVFSGAVDAATTHTDGSPPRAYAGTNGGGDTRISGSL